MLSLAGGFASPVSAARALTYHLLSLFFSRDFIYFNLNMILGISKSYSAAPTSFHVLNFRTLFTDEPFL